MEQKYKDLTALTRQGKNNVEDYQAIWAETDEWAKWFQERVDVAKGMESAMQRRRKAAEGENESIQGETE